MRTKNGKKVDWWVVPSLVFVFIGGVLIGVGYATNVLCDTTQDDSNNAWRISSWGKETDVELAKQLNNAREYEADLELKLYYARWNRERLEADYAARFNDAAVRYHTLENSAVVRIEYNETEIAEIEVTERTSHAQFNATKEQHCEPCLTKRIYTLPEGYMGYFQNVFNASTLCYDFANDPEGIGKQVNKTIEEHPNDWGQYMDWTPHTNDPIVEIAYSTNVSRPEYRDVYDGCKST